MSKVGFYQFNPRFGRPDQNLSQVLEALKDITADLVVLPELPFTGYSFESRQQLEKLAEDPDNSTSVSQLTDLCRQRQIHLVTGFAEKHRDKVFNTALLIGPDGIVARYRKLHLFDREKDLFDPGDTPLAVHQIGELRVGMMVCFDWVFPEVARCLALAGANVLCHPANLVLTFCQQTMLTRSLENGVFSITANRTGSESGPQGTLCFTGTSQLTTPRGRLIFQADSDSSCLHIVEIDPTDAEDKKLTPGNHLFTDRRPEFYQRLTNQDQKN